VKKVSVALLIFAFGVLALALYRLLFVDLAHGQAPDTWNRATPDECVASVDDREKLRAMMLESFDEAFKLTAHNLYINWLKDYTKEPDRALKGMVNNRHAWIRTRMYGRAYNPKICEDKQ